MIKKFLTSLATFIFDTVEVIVMALVLFAIAYLFLVQPHQIKGNSMLPGFEDQTYILTEKISYRFRQPQRGDVVVFKYPKAHEYDYIKRIVGLPGEKLLIENGKVAIFNSEMPEGFHLTESYTTERTGGRTTIKEGTPFQIPDGEYVVMGDNRTRSSDSREWGTVKREEVIGRAWVAYWPPQALALLEKTEY